VTEPEGTPSLRTAITRLADRASTDRTQLDSLLDEVWIGHLALVAPAGHPVVLPVLIGRDRDRVLIHGSTGAGWMRVAAGGGEVSLAVTAADGIVVARSAFESSMRYRSAVLFGRCLVLEGEEKLAALDHLTNVVIPGRTSEVRRPNAKELAATAVLALPIEEWSLKVNAKWPEDPDEDVAGPAWAGVIPMTTAFGSPLAAPDLQAGIDMPPSVHGIVERSIVERSIVERSIVERARS
jgi:nitroimidazol reductase NimA-like FMN-containing flavoprotein (pyridoxamine 5'-phosphate oxidase superfamily)